VLHIASLFQRLIFELIFFVSYLFVLKDNESCVNGLHCASYTK
jgi:hypothetical protein